jgi:peptide/nickel transport system substrate-binding protein
MGGETDIDEALSGPVVDRRTTVELLGAAGMFGLAGFAGRVEADQIEASSAIQEQPQTGGRLQAGWFTGSIDNLDPPYISVGIRFQLAANVFNGLVTLEPDLTVRGDLARDWTVSDDGTTFTFDLREGVTFHNGAEFTAEDVRYTIDRTISEETPAAGKLETLEPVDESGVVVQDDYTVELNWQQPMAPALIYLTRGPGRAATIVSRDAIEEMGQEQYAITPVGTGPFEVTEHEVGSHITLDAYDDYFETDENGNQLPYLDGIDVRPIPEPATLVNALRSGDVDFVNEVPLQNVDRVEEAGNVELLTAPGVNWIGFSMNQQREPFDSETARLGIAKSIDREAFVETAFFGNAIPDTGPINKATEWVWREDKPTDQDYNPKEGQRLLEEAGAANASFSILAAEGDTRAARTMRQQLQQAGLDVQVDQVTTSTYWDRFSEAGEYDATIAGSVGDPDPDQSLWNFYRKPDEGGVWNWTFFEDDEVHRLLEEQRRELDRERRKELLRELEDRLIATAPHAYLYHTDDIAARNSNVRGFVHIPFLRNFHGVWLAQ